MHQFHAQPQVNVDRLRRAIGITNAGLVAAAYLAAYAYYLAYGVLNFFAVAIFTFWCAYVQFKIRSRTRSKRDNAFLFTLQNVGWACFGAIVTISQFRTALFHLFGK